MTVVYLQSLDGENIIALDCTTDVQMSRSNQTTSSSVMSGANVSDTYKIGNKSVSFNGLVSYNKFSGQIVIPDPIEFQNQIDKLVGDYTRFTLYGNDLIPSIKNCVLTSESYTQDTFEDTIRVSLSVQEVFVTNAAQRTSIKVPLPASSTKGQLKSKEDGGSGVKKKVKIRRNQLPGVLGGYVYVVSDE